MPFRPPELDTSRAANMLMPVSQLLWYVAHTRPRREKNCCNIASGKRSLPACYAIPRPTNIAARRSFSKNRSSPATCSSTSCPPNAAWFCKATIWPIFWRFPTSLCSSGNLTKFHSHWKLIWKFALAPTIGEGTES